MSGDPNDPLAGIDLSRYAPDAPTSAAPPVAADPSDPLHGIDTSQYTPDTPAKAPGTAFPTPHPVTGNEPWSQIFGAAPGNAASGVGQIGEGLYNSAKAVPKIIAEGPAHTAVAASGIEPYLNMYADKARHTVLGDSAADWLNKKIGYAPPATQAEQDAVKAKAAQVGPNLYGAAKQAGSDLYDRFLTVPGWKKAIGNNPVGAGLDVASIVDPALRLGVAARGLDAAKLIGSPEFASNLARTGLDLAPEDIPAAHHQVIADVVRQKGLTPASIREGVGVASTGVTPTRGATTGFAPAEGTEAQAANASGAGAARAQNNLTGIAGGQPTSPAELGQSFLDHVAAKKQNVSQMYRGAGDPDDAFHPYVTNVILDNVRNALRAQEPLFAPNGGASSFDTLAPTESAVQKMQRQLSNPPADQPINMKYLDRVRKDLTNLPKGASDTDWHFSGVAGNAFDRGVSEAAKMDGMYSGNGPQAAANIEAARAAAAENFANFGTGPKVPASVRTVLRSYSEDPNAAGATLHSALLNPRTGPGLYDHLSNAGFGPQLDQYLGPQLLQGDTASVAKAVQSPIAQRVFTPDELGDAHFHNQARSIYESKNTAPEPQGKVKTVAKAAVPVLAAGAAGAVGSHYGSIGAGIGASVLGGLAEQGLEHAAGKVGGLSGSARELAGAPKTFAPALKSGAIRAADVATGVNAAAKTGHPAPFKRGGSVKAGHQHLVDRLMREVEKAKRAEKGRTSVLLRQPDEAIAKALNVAQAAI